MIENCDCGVICCRLDRLTRCKIRAICDRHDRYILAEEAEAAEVRAKLAALIKRTRGSVIHR